MSEQAKNPTPRPKKKRRPRWQRILIHYWPLVRLCLLALLCLTLIIMAIVALVKSEAVQQVAEEMIEAYRNALGIETDYLITRPGEGARVLYKA